MLKITQSKKITEIEFPQPLFESRKIANASHETLGEFSLYVGLSQKYAQDIKNYSLDQNDKPLQKGTTDYKRFGTTDYQQRYKQKPRTQIIMVHDQTDQIVAFSWFGERSLPDNIEYRESPKHDSSKVKSDTDQLWFTSSYRTYGAYRGAKISYTFSAYILKLFKQLHPKTSMWLAVQKDNVPALNLYKKLGFETIALDAQEGEYIMKLTEEN